MSIFGPILGGYGFGGPFGYGPWATKVDAPADPDAKPEPGDPLERPDWFGFGAAQRGLPGFTKAPDGCDPVYWQMRKYSALVLAYAVTTGPIFAGTRTLEICKDDGSPTTQRPGGPLAGDGPKEAPEDKIKADMVRHFDPLWPEILNGLEGINFGRWDQEVRWDRKAGLTLPIEFRDFIPGQVGLLYDPYGDFAGIRYQNQDRAPQYVLHHVHQRHFDRLNGFPRLENARQEWWDNAGTGGTGESLRRTEGKASGISLILWFDREYKFTDNNGNQVSANTVGQTTFDALSTGGAALVPRHSHKRAAIEKEPKLAEHRPVEVQTLDWGNTAPAILAHLAVLDARDKRIMRAYGRPERESTEGQHGTKAEAGVHGQIGVLDSEKVHAELVRSFNQQTWRTTLITNFGERYLDRLYWKPTPLADDSKQFLQTAALAMLAAPGDPLPAQVDRKALLQKVELPYDESYVAPPALPAEPTPPEGGGGNNGQLQPGTNGNGRANGNRMALSSYGEDGPESEGPFDDYALALNCGTGAGGFKSGNVCSKGGRQFVVSKVTRAGMVHGRGADESPDVPPVGLGHVSEFSPVADKAGSLADAPLPEFAAKVQAIGDRLPGFADNKIYLSHLYDAAREVDPSLTVAEFKSKMKAANTEGLLKLSRADLPLNPAEEARGEIDLGHGATAHFLLVRSDPNRRQVARSR